MREIITLDLQKSVTAFSPTVCLRARRGDKKSLTRTFQVLDGGDPVDLTGLTVAFMATDAGGSPIMEEVESKEASGIFTYTLPTAVAAVRGAVTMAYFRVEGEDWVGSTESMRIQVLDNVDLDPEQDGPYVPMLDRILEAAEEAAQNAATITEAGTEAVNDCKQATAAANQAEGLRADAEEQRVQAENARKQGYENEMEQWRQAVNGLTSGICVDDDGYLCIEVLE